MDKLDSLHHFVSQFYLRNFASRRHGDSAYIYVYEKNTPPIEADIRHVASTRGFYNAEEVDTLQKTDMVEGMFEKIENKVAPIFRKILEQDDTILSQRDRAELDCFFALQYVRTPQFRELLLEFDREIRKHTLKSLAQDKARLRRVIEKATTRTVSDSVLEEITNIIQDFDEHFEITQEGGESGLIKLALKFSLEFAPYFSSKHLALGKTNSQTVFVTSNNPVIVIPQDNQLMKGIENSVLVIPISPERCLIYHPEEDRGIYILGEKQVTRINECVMFLADKTIYANLPSKTIAKTFARTESGGGMNTKSLFSKDSSLLITSSKPMPYLVKDIFPNLDQVE